MGAESMQFDAAQSFSTQFDAVSMQFGAVSVQFDAAQSLQPQLAVHLVGPFRLVTIWLAARDNPYSISVFASHYISARSCQVSNGCKVVVGLGPCQRSAPRTHYSSVAVVVPLPPQTDELHASRAFVALIGKKHHRPIA
jgi:hypothetical protein